MPDISPTMLAASNHVGNYTVGFVQVGEGGRKLLGSGTLISAGTSQGVLTATSVLGRLPKDRRLGFVLRTELGQISLEASELSCVALDSGLGVVKLPDSAARRFDEWKRFVDLLALANPDAGEWCWCVNGFTSELTTTQLPMDCFDMVVGYTNATGLAKGTALEGSDIELW